MTIELDQLHRLDKIDQLINEETLTLADKLSNITFFGELKNTQREHTENGQCNFFVLMTEAKGNVPITADCRINLFNEDGAHYHLELSNTMCSLCEISLDQRIVSKTKIVKRNKINSSQKKTRNCE